LHDKSGILVASGPCLICRDPEFIQNRVGSQRRARCISSDSTTGRPKCASVRAVSDCEVAIAIEGDTLPCITASGIKNHGRVAGYVVEKNIVGVVVAGVARRPVVCLANVGCGAITSPVVSSLATRCEWRGQQSQCQSGRAGDGEARAGRRERCSGGDHEFGGLILEEIKLIPRILSCDANESQAGDRRRRVDGN